ncbi:MAG: NADH-quinone oxidoreductase subunit NuoG [Limnobacter sp.]|uniref:NADH-quinone oxidoreductase subunit NuoG n=1 Tax=Limnobacter sp. TaxID=2003368 RepID=UPI0022C3D8E5|nr:NADH-quinone oxidoreductase subunit NuoG [Limnobacter sp.]MCZ8015734.1 NADH-quinone oxidoreductase subunit NuoG [Limnobacter sp.]
MVELEIDGVKVEVAEGSMLITAAEKAGSYVPHFCYHKKLSIAANCRMCLVDVEKAPKPLPACATPVSPGMIVRTKSEKAVNAQKSVMEFLLINHPLDCPICDQGGECQLQDLSVGYGGVSSRYQEEKRVVFFKDIGPLVSAKEMSRCIHCTRCVRFGQEVAGVMELGMANRGEHSEILSFVGNSVDSELSGNMIDICPVGALTSKPFRYQARTWEMARRKSVGAHDSLGSNVVVQVKADKVMRIVPQENESINECWISDRDRFSYEGLQAADRLTEPMIKKNGQWVTTDWQTALNVVFEGIKKARRESADLNSIAMLMSPNSTFEEMALAKALMNGVGSTSIDAGLRHSANLNLAGAMPWLGASVQQLADAESIVVVGADPRNDQPLLTQRIRQAAKQGARVVIVNAGGLDPLMPKAVWLKAAPSTWADALGHDAVSNALSAPEGGKFVLVGQQVLMSPFAGQVLAKAAELAKFTGSTLGFLGDGANWVGSFVTGLQASATSGKNAKAMLAGKAKAAIVFGTEPDLDSVEGQKIVRGLIDAEFVVQASAFVGNAKQYADVLLPIAPSTETSGTFINIAGQVQSFKAAVRPLGETRPGWKVLRVLGNLLGLDGFEFNSSEEVLKAFMPTNLASLLNNVVPEQTVSGTVLNGKLELAAYAPIYDTDSLVRRAESLRKTKAAKPAMVQIGVQTANALALKTGDKVQLKDSEGGSLQAAVLVNKTIAENTVLIPMGRIETQSLRTVFGGAVLEAVVASEVQA